MNDYIYADGFEDGYRQGQKDAQMKQEFIRMAEYVDMFLECSDRQKEELLGFISRLAEYMPWTERD